MKKLFAILLVLALCFSFAACGGSKDEASDEAVEAPAKEKRAVLLSSFTMAADFEKMVWRGFQNLEATGWEVKYIEALDPAEYEESIYAIGEAGYPIMFIRGDAMGSSFLELAEDFHAMYPDVYVVIVDTYLEHDFDFVTCITIDPYESSFIAGYVAALTTESNTIGWIGHKEGTTMTRFCNGYTAGAKYANPDITVVPAYTGAPRDPEAGVETTRQMIANNPEVDVIMHAAYISGNGVISVCEENGIPCIGCDDWQSEVGETVFWSALKPADILVFNIANKWYEGEVFPAQMSFDIEAGAVPYDTRDYSALPDDVAAKVSELMDGITAGTVDMYYGEYVDMKLDY